MEHPVFDPSTETLSDFMEFDRVVRVEDDGTVWATGEPAPTVDDEDVLTPGWSLVIGFSNQYSYGGPIMHPSEYIGGGLETHILDNPGDYVTVVVYDTDDDDYTDPVGWAIAYRPLF